MPRGCALAGGTADVVGNVRYWHNADIAPLGDQRFLEHPRLSMVAPWTRGHMFKMHGHAVPALPCRIPFEDRDENNRIRCYGRCACTRVDTGQRGAQAPEASHEAYHCCTATDCLHRRRLYARAVRLPPEIGGRSTS
jgi:hypothetical protein